MMHAVISVSQEEADGDPRNHIVELTPLSLDTVTLVYSQARAKDSEKTTQQNKTHFARLAHKHELVPTVHKCVPP